MTNQNISRQCSIYECTREVLCRTWCELHYARWRRYGNPELVYQNTSLKRTLHERFEERVDKTAGFGRNGNCWKWMGSAGKYGHITFQKKRHLAHHLAWEYANGRAVQQGLWILHSCDNPLCVNPQHLREGTRQDNIADMVSRNRHVKGQQVRLDAFTEAEVRAIRVLIQEGIAHKEIASMLNIKNARRLSAIKHNQYYQWVK